MVCACLTQVYLELNQLYRWHNLIPEQLNFTDGPHALGDFIWNPAQLTQVIITTMPFVHVWRPPMAKKSNDHGNGLGVPREHTHAYGMLLGVPLLV